MRIGIDSIVASTCLQSLHPLAIWRESIHTRRRNAETWELRLPSSLRLGARIRKQGSAYWFTLWFSAPRALMGHNSTPIRSSRLIDAVVIVERELGLLFPNWHDRPNLAAWHLTSVDLCLDLCTDSPVALIESLVRVPVPKTWRLSRRGTKSRTLYAKQRDQMVRIYSKEHEVPSRKKYAAGDEIELSRGVVRIEHQLRRAAKARVLPQAKFVRDLFQLDQGNFHTAMRSVLEPLFRNHKPTSPEEVVERLESTFRRKKALRLIRLYDRIASLPDADRCRLSKSEQRDVKDIRNAGVGFGHVPGHEIRALSDLTSCHFGTETHKSAPNPSDFPPFVNNALRPAEPMASAYRQPRVAGDPVWTLQKAIAFESLSLHPRLWRTTCEMPRGPPSPITSALGSPMTFRSNILRLCGFCGYGRAFCVDRVTGRLRA